MLKEIIISDPEILGGTPVFAGTRVPVEVLFDYLEDGYTIDGFLEDYPSVTKRQALGVLEYFQSFLVKDNLSKLYEIAS